MVYDTHGRTLLRVGTYRLFASVSVAIYTVALATFAPGVYALGACVFAFDLVYKSGLSYLWDRLWNRIRWGRRVVTYPGACVWLTGLPASGKTTIAKELIRQLDAMLVPCDRLDGDVSRRSFCADLTFSKADRDENVRRNAMVAAYLSHSGSVVVCALVSPYAEARERARGICKNFIEVYVKTPVEICAHRDRGRGSDLYERAAKGELKGLTGVDDPYEVPRCPDLVIDTTYYTAEIAARVILGQLQAMGLLDGARQHG